MCECMRVVSIIRSARTNMMAIGLVSDQQVAMLYVC